MPFLKIVLASFVISFASSQEVTNEKPFLRIVAPKYLCDEPTKLNSSESESSNKLTVGLQTRVGQRLKYKLSIDFILLDGFKNQRHTLSIWKNVRELQAKFAVKNISDEISLKNQIEIDALELTPQVVYTFKIIGYDENNQASDEQNFTITYRGDQKLQTVQPNIGDGVSLLLFGPETFYTDLELLAVADVLFCDPINDYFFQWKIDGITSESFNDEYLNVKGNTLKLPAGTLEDDKTYEILVTIHNNKSQILASLSLSIKVYSKEINAQNIPADCNVGVNREVPFVTTLYPKSMVESMNVKWACVIEESECAHVFTNSTESLRVSAIFPSEGNYMLNTDVTIKGSTKTSNTKIVADAKVIPHVEIKYFPQQPLSVVDSNEIVATIMDLVPKCVAYWNIVTDEDGLAKPRNDSMENVGMISIKDYEEHFLQELVDYDNNTLSKDTTLTIPANALYADSIYKFRLNVICPEPLTDTMQPIDRKNITTYFDIVFETNGPPKPLPLVVLPFKGIPMKDVFTFKTGAAKERQSDYPLKYLFGYQIDKLIIYIGTFYEFQVARTQLPYSDEIFTFMQVTDNNNATVYVKGPKIKANVQHKFTKEEIDFKLSEIQGTLKRSEYSKTLNSAVVLILTQRKFAEEDDAKKYENQIYQMLKSELDSLQSTKSSTFVHQQKIIEFIKMTNNLLSIMTVYDEAFVENILNLAEQQSRRIKRTAISKSMRNRNIMTHDPDYIKNVLSLSDMLISSSNIETVKREKKRYVEKIHKFIASLCQDQYLNSHVIQSKYMTFDVSKIYSRQLFIETQKFPNDTATVMFSSNLNFPSKFVCIGKIKYLIDMFDESLKDNSENIVYETRILDDTGIGQKDVIESENIGEFSVMEIPVINGKANEQSCFMWTKNQWASNECEQQVVNQSRIVCKCKTAESSVIIKYQKSSGNENSKNKSTTTTKTYTSSPLTTESSNKKKTESSKKETTQGIYSTEYAIVKTTISGESMKIPDTKTTKEPSKYTTLEAPITINGMNKLSTNNMEITLATDIATTNKVESSSELFIKTTNPINSNTEPTTQPQSSKIPDTLFTHGLENIKSTYITDIPESTTGQEAFKNQSIQATTIFEEKVTTESYTQTINNKNNNQATDNIKSSSTMSATSMQSTTIEKIEQSTEVSKHVELTISSISTDEIKQATTEKITNGELNNNEKDVSKNIEKKTSTETVDKIKLQTTHMPSTIVTKESNSNSTNADVIEANIGLNMWFVLGMLCFFFGLILLLILIHRCRRFSETYINLPMRHPSNNIKYAKYHDEFIMRG